MTASTANSQMIVPMARFPLISAAINMRNETAVDDGTLMRYDDTTRLEQNTEFIKVAKGHPSLMESSSFDHQQTSHKQAPCRKAGSKKSPPSVNTHLQAPSDSKQSVRQVTENGHHYQVQYYDEFNKMREKLFRLLSKVPIQVEPMIGCIASQSAAAAAATTAAAAAADNQCCSSSSSSSISSQQSSSRQQPSMIDRKPLLIKYYNEKFLNDILDLHFNCSLMKLNFENNSSPPSSSSNNTLPKHQQHAQYDNSSGQEASLFTREACSCFSNTPTTMTATTTTTPFDPHDNHHHQQLSMPTYGSANSITASFYQAPQHQHQQQPSSNSFYLQNNANQACMMDWQQSASATINHLSSSWHGSSSLSCYDNIEQGNYNVKSTATNQQQQQSTTTAASIKGKHV